MYSKGKNSGGNVDVQANEKWDKPISVGEAPGFLNSWWGAAPERRDSHEHSAEAKAFHDYGFVNSGYPNGLHPGHPVMSGPGMPPPQLGPPGPDPVQQQLRQRPGPPSMLPPVAAGGMPGPGNPAQAIRFHPQGPPGTGFPGGPGGGMINPQHGGVLPQHQHPTASVVAIGGHPRPRWVGPPVMGPQSACPQQPGGGPSVNCSGAVSSSGGPGSAGPCTVSNIVRSPGHPGTPNQQHHLQPHLSSPGPLGSQPNCQGDHQPPGPVLNAGGPSGNNHLHHQQPRHPTPPHYINTTGGSGGPPQSNQLSSSDYPPNRRPSPHLGLPPFTTESGAALFAANNPLMSVPADAAAMLNGSNGPLGGPPRGMVPPPQSEYVNAPQPVVVSSSGELKASPNPPGGLPPPGMGQDGPSQPPPSGLIPNSDYNNNNSTTPGSVNNNIDPGSMMMPPPQSQHMIPATAGGGPPPPPQYGSSNSASSQSPAAAGGPGSVQFPPEYPFS